MQVRPSYDKLGLYVSVLIQYWILGEPIIDRETLSLVEVNPG